MGVVKYSVFGNYLKVIKVFGLVALDHLGGPPNPTCCRKIKQHLAWVNDNRTLIFMYFLSIKDIMVNQLQCKAIKTYTSQTYTSQHKRRR